MDRPGMESIPPDRGRSAAGTAGATRSQVDHPSGPARRIIPGNPNSPGTESETVEPECANPSRLPPAKEGPRARSLSGGDAAAREYRVPARPDPSIRWRPSRHISSVSRARVHGVSRIGAFKELGTVSRPIAGDL